MYNDNVEKKVWWLGEGDVVDDSVNNEMPHSCRSFSYGNLFLNIKMSSPNLGPRCA